MVLSVNIAPSNSMVFLDGSSRIKVPEILSDRVLVWSTPSCIATACFPEVDGETHIVFGRDDEVTPLAHLVFDGFLETPLRQVRITSVSDDIILSMDVPQEITRVRIWHSHPRWPECVTIGLGI